MRALYVCTCCSVHLCCPQALPRADHYQMCRHEEAGRHGRGGTDVKHFDNLRTDS